MIPNSLLVVIKLASKSLLFSSPASNCRNNTRYSRVLNYRATLAGRPVPTVVDIINNDCLTPAITGFVNVQLITS